MWIAGSVEHSHIKRKTDTASGLKCLTVTYTTVLTASPQLLILPTNLSIIDTLK